MLQNFKLTKANVYIDGANWFGATEEFTTPDFNEVSVTHKPLGSKGTTSYNAGVEELKGKLKLNSVNPAYYGVHNNHIVTRLVQVRGVLEQFVAGDRIGQQPVICDLKIRFIKSTGHDHKAQEAVMIDAEYTAYHVRVMIGALEKLYFNADTQEYRIDGVDQNAFERAILGL